MRANTQEAIPNTPSAEIPPGTAYNPQPAEGDLILPMPNGAEMVFRRVTVPGDNFWGDERRVIQIGDADGGIFEGLQRAQVSGSFRDSQNGNWFYYIGKYEVTKGQYVAVMGLEALSERSADPQDRRIGKLQGKALERALSLPLAAVSWPEFQAFVHRYNKWLFDSEYPERLANMPRLNDAPGFLRLPTELEWEYATRGGSDAVRAKNFSQRLPFEPGQLRKHAWYLENAKHKTRPIGLREANALGLHDTLGNVQELMSGRFQPEIWQGKPGGLSARGGSVSTPALRMRSAYRQEVEIYYWDPDKKIVQERRSFTTGIRLAIGSNVVVNSKLREALSREYRSYQDGIRRAMPVGRTLDNPVVQAASGLGGVQQIVEELITKNPALETNLRTIRSRIEKAEQQLDFGLRAAARSSAQDGLRNGSDLARDVFKLASLERQAQKTRDLNRLSKRYGDLLKRIERQIDARRESADEVFQRYTENVSRLGEYGQTHIDQALVALREERLTTRARAALQLLEKHVSDYLRFRRIPEGWREQFRERFKDFPG